MLNCDCITKGKTTVSHEHRGHITDLPTIVALLNNIDQYMWSAVRLMSRPDHMTQSPVIIVTADQLE